MNSKHAESPLRVEQAQATHERIFDAVTRIFQRDPDSDLSFDEIALEARIGRRTIFRHFPTKESLLDAYWLKINNSLGVRFWPDSEADLTRLPERLFASFDQIEGIVRASHASPSGRKMRMRANDVRQAAFRKSLADAARHLPPERARQLEAVVQLLFSATAWITMKDYWGLSGPQSGRAAAWAIDALIKAARDEAGG